MHHRITIIPQDLDEIHVTKLLGWALMSAASQGARFWEPLAHEDGAIKLATADPTDFDTLQKLQFILKKDLRPVRSSREQIALAIDRHYGR